MNKFSQLDFEMWGRQVAVGYLENNTSMNEAITKIAQENNFNHQHVARVAEEANNQVFLQKFGHASKEKEDNYIEFDVADARVVSKTLTTPPKIASADDYILSPEEHNNFSTSERRVRTFIAGPAEPTEGEKNAMIYTAVGVRGEFENKMNTLSVDFDEKIAELKQMYKVASNTTEATQALQLFIANNYESNSLQEKLASQVLTDVKIGEDVETTTKILNEDNPLIQTFSEAIKLGEAYTDMYNTGPDMTRIQILGRRNEKTASYALKVEDSLWKWLTAAGLTGGALAATHKLGYEKGKKVQAIKMSPMKTLPKTHNPRR